jgi:DNA-binding NarL/FixJ family response regulator
MTRVFLADSLPAERSALKLLLLDLKMEVVGDTSDWLTTFDLAPASRLNMLLVEWDLLPADSNTALTALRTACGSPVVIVLISHMIVRKQAALSFGADVLISKNESSDLVIERLRAAAGNIRS